MSNESYLNDAASNLKVNVAQLRSMAAKLVFIENAIQGNPCNIKALDVFERIHGLTPGIITKIFAKINSESANSTNKAESVAVLSQCVAGAKLVDIYENILYPII